MYYSNPISTEITDIKAREIIDSRGNPTVEVDVVLANGVVGSAAVPSGASTGEREALELRDGKASAEQLASLEDISSSDAQKRFNGKGVLVAVHNVLNPLKDVVLGLDATRQADIDRYMIEADGTENKSNFGANAILGVSLAVAKAAALSYKMPLFQYIGGIHAHVLPVPMMNVLNGGAHSDAPIDIQEFMLVPFRANSIRESIRMGAETFHALKSILHDMHLSTAVGDEGGFAPNLASNEQALEVIVQAIEKAGYRPGTDIAIAIDAASSEFYDEHSQEYIFKKSDGSHHSASQMIKYYQHLIEQYPLISIEDGLAQNDWTGWSEMTAKIGGKTKIVGDDLFVTNKKYLLKGLEEKAANAILIKLNQIGSLSETLDTIFTAAHAGITHIVSHRSGETEDTTLADVAVGTNALFIKTGSMSRTDRLCKYNRLIRIEETLGSQAIFAGNLL